MWKILSKITSHWCYRNNNSFWEQRHASSYNTIYIIIITNLWHLRCIYIEYRITVTAIEIVISFLCESNADSADCTSMHWVQTFSEPYIRFVRTVHRKKCFVELTRILVENERSRILVKFTRFLFKSIKIVIEITNI